MPDLGKKGKTAVLLMAFGAAASPDEIPAFLKDVCGGREIPDQLVKEVIKRYSLMGGRSPLVEITQQQAEALQELLDEGYGDESQVKVYVGMRHSAPTIASAVKKIASEGHSRVIAFPLTPYRSRVTTGSYLAKLQAAIKEAGVSLEVVRVPHWHDNPLLIQAFAQRAQDALRRVPEELEPETVMLLSAHSLPEKTLGEGDQYSGDLAVTAEAVAGAVGLDNWCLAYQCRGGSGDERWLGPDVSEVLESLARQGARSILVNPIGFLSDHMETLYDLDMAYRGIAERLGLRFVRAEALNNSLTFVRCLADVADSVLEH